MRCLEIFGGGVVERDGGWMNAVSLRFGFYRIMEHPTELLAVGGLEDEDVIWRWFWFGEDKRATHFAVRVTALAHVTQA